MSSLRSPTPTAVNTLFNAEAWCHRNVTPGPRRCTNPCYVCHQDHIDGRENRMNDGDLQEALQFQRRRHDQSLEKPLRRPHAPAWRPSATGRSSSYISEDNYSELPSRLREKNFKGWIPDLKNLHLGAEAFDEHGFAKDGSQWVAFNYKPFPSTFWPTNGSTDDVMIRLPETFRSDRDGKPSLDIYKANLAILEANIKGVNSIGSLPVDEELLGRDLDGDGNLGNASEIREVSAWVGAAETVPMETHLYPEGTEFLHTVRYVGVAKDKSIGVSTRMKEVRYSRKVKAYSKAMYCAEIRPGGDGKGGGQPSLVS